MANRSKAKGSRGEREILDLLQTVVNEEYGRVKRTPPELSRGPHGKDIVGLPWLAPEVKRHEPPKVAGSNNRLGELTPAQVAAFWEQCKRQAVVPENAPVTGYAREPVLFYRMNNRPWNVRMFGYLGINGRSERVRCPVDTTLEAFVAWFRLRIRADIALDPPFG